MFDNISKTVYPKIMKKINKNKKLISLFMLSFVLFATLFCCCFNSEAQADNVYTKGQLKSSCHSQEQKNSNKSTQSDDCQCANTLDAVFEGNLQISNIQFSLLNYIEHASYYFKRMALLDQKQQLFSKHSPPIFHQNSLPIYLQISVLRI